MTSGSCFTAWEAMIAEAEKEAKTHVELSQKLSQSVANQLSEITSRKRVLKKKVRTKTTSYMFESTMSLCHHAQMYSAWICSPLETHKPLHHKYSKIIVVVCSKVSPNIFNYFGNTLISYYNQSCCFFYL